MNEVKSNKQTVGKDWSQDRKGAFEFVFNTHFWGNRSNSGKGEKGGWKVRGKK
ncbi:hypothetical protein [Alishewanella phage vB_AspM_Slickus01]|nr:hypothetical protein [Alishewanella phage vB_AspM_Slicko01]WGH49752.1 hypothetical protein [Alishewanella phage vB_AspM_Slickus01]